MKVERETVQRMIYVGITWVLIGLKRTNAYVYNVCGIYVDLTLNKSNDLRELSYTNICKGNIKSTHVTIHVYYT